MVHQRRQARPKEEYAEYLNYSDAAYCHIPQHISLRWYTKRVYCSSAWVRPDHLGFAFLQLKYAKPFSICFASLSWSPYGYVPPNPKRACTFVGDFTPSDPSP